MPTNEQVLKCNEALDLLEDERLPWETSLSVSDFQRAIGPKAADIEKLRLSIAKEFAQLDENGKPIETITSKGSTISIAPSKMGEFVEKLTTLMDAEYPGAPTIRSSLFEGMELPHKISSAIHPFLERGE